MNFFGREKELGKLNDMYEENGFSFACIYGRRRVGKSSILKKWIEKSNVKYIFFTGIEFNDSINLSNFSKQVFNVYPRGEKYIKVFKNWETAFDYLYEEMGNEKLILIIDEYPYIAESNKSLSSIIQKYIDEKFAYTNLKLVLCGSSMSFMKKQLLGYESPLYGRRTLQFEVKSFNYYDTSKMVNNYNNEDKFLMYAVSGGIPYYINLLNKNKSLRSGIKNELFSKYGSLYEEPYNLIKQELREPNLYNSIIASVANGDTRVSIIANRINEDLIKVNKYLSVLIELDIIQKENPVFNDVKRKSVYKIKDNMYVFWYRFVGSNIFKIENDNGDNILENIEKNGELSNYLGYVFEDVCKQYLIINQKKYFKFDNLGRWWGGNPVTKQEEEIDIVGYNASYILFGECKYINELVGIEVLDNLVRKSKLINHNKNEIYVLFSKKGFSETLIEKVKFDKNIKLVKLDDMY